jgi:hypothetical protein
MGQTGLVRVAYQDSPRVKFQDHSSRNLKLYKARMSISAWFVDKPFRSLGANGISLSSPLECEQRHSLP